MGQGQSRLLNAGQLDSSRTGIIHVTTREEHGSRPGKRLKGVFNYQSL
jgi:hypothetical protein